MSVLEHPCSKDRLPLYVANLTMNCATPLFYPANVPNDQIPAWAKKKSGQVRPDCLCTYMISIDARSSAESIDEVAELLQLSPLQRDVTPIRRKQQIYEFFGILGDACIPEEDEM